MIHIIKYWRGREKERWEELDSLFGFEVFRAFWRDELNQAEDSHEQKSGF